jgi:hypothetical protein
MVHAEEERVIVREIIAIIDASTDKELNRPNIPLPEELPEQTTDRTVWQPCKQLLPKDSQV